MSKQPAVSERSALVTEAECAALRAAGHASAMADALHDAGHAFDAAGLIELARDLGKVAELHRLYSARLAGIIRRLGEAP